ncbi:MAG: hypothetical protein Fur0044_25770 [Anaerolineae bacterium]
MPGDDARTKLMRGSYRHELPAKCEMEVFTMLLRYGIIKARFPKGANYDHSKG